MSFSRRKFLAQSVLSYFGIGVIAITNSACVQKKIINIKSNTLRKPIVVSTWNTSDSASEAMRVLRDNGNSLDAVENGVRIAEADPKNMTVGYGGRPDRDGNVTLDACIMNSEGNAGSVMFLQHIKHPVTLARKVMEDSPHVILAGEGALQFALEQGMKKENLLTAESEKAWKKWLKSSKYKPIINIENHDTIGMLAMDNNGDISGACTTSGLAYKIKGRVGDSPVIGAGLFIDNEIGGAVATGLGEAVLKSLGSFLIVELMRNGMSPEEACREAVLRIVKKQKDYHNFQICYIAMNKKGEIGSFSIHKGFVYAENTLSESTTKKSDYYVKG